MTAGSCDDHYTVVFDVNVYIDVAELLGPPFSWDRFTELTVQHRSLPLPHPTDARVDCLRAIAVSMSGRLAGQRPLEVWTSDHIDNLVANKAIEQLGWTEEDAVALVDDFVYVLLERSGGGTVGVVDIPMGCPPLDREDGCVYRTANEAAYDIELAQRFCVTRDRPFLNQAPSNVTMMYPHEWVQLVRRARALLAMGPMKPDLA